MMTPKQIRDDALKKMGIERKTSKMRSHLIPTFPADHTILSRIYDAQRAAASTAIRRCEIDDDGDIIALVEEPGYTGDLTTGIRRDVFLQPVVLATRKDRDGHPHLTLGMLDRITRECRVVQRSCGHYECVDRADGCGMEKQILHGLHRMEQTPCDACY